MLTLDKIIEDYTVKQPRVTLTGYILARSLGVHKADMDSSLIIMLEEIKAK